MIRSDLSFELLGKTRAKILLSLLKGDDTVVGIAATQKIIRPGIRKHLSYKEKLGIVGSYFKQDGVGRPKKFYTITSLGRNLFPKMYDQMLLELIARLSNGNLEGGRNVVEKAMEDISTDLAEKFNSRTNNIAIDDKLSALEGYLNELGFSTEVSRRKDGQISIVRTDCALYNVALTNYDQICLGFDTRLISKCLEGSHVELLHCMALGRSNCHHSVTILSCS